MQKTLKPILIILALVVVGALVYIFLIKKEEVPALTRETSSGVVVDASAPRNQQVADINIDEFQKLLIQIDRIKLNGQVFNAEQYATLIDHTQTALVKLEETRLIAPVGKPNPFRDLNGTSAVQVQPVIPSTIKRDR